MPTPENLATDATVAIMLADGFEEVEALAVADVLYRAGVRADLISVTDARHVTSSHGIRVVADLMLEDVDLSTYTVLFLPGGMPGTLNLKATPAIQVEALRRSDASQPIAAICAAPSILSELGLLDGRHATANPAFVKAIAEGGTTSVALTLKRTVAKVAVQTSVDASFNSKYSGTLTVTGTKVVRAASQTPIIAPATPTPGAMTYTHTQAPAAASGKYNNLFYIFENGALAEASRVALEITATYDADGNASTTADRMEVVYTVPLTGKAGGEIARNGYYRVAANITGLVGQVCQVSVSVAEWETPVTQSVDLGA